MRNCVAAVQAVHHHYFSMLSKAIAAWHQVLRMSAMKQQLVRTADEHCRQLAKAKTFKVILFPAAECWFWVQALLLLYGSWLPAILFWQPCLAGSIPQFLLKVCVVSQQCSN